MNWSILFLVVAVFLGTIHFSPTDPDYKKLWKEVHRLEQKGLYASAEAKVDKIRDLALAEGHQKQLLKSELYLSKYRGKLQESDIQVSIRSLEKALSGFDDVILKSITHSYLGDLRLHSSRIEDAKSDRAASFKRATNHFAQSLVALDSLISIDAKEWSLLLDTSENNKYPKSNLADLLFLKARPVFYKNHGHLKALPENIHQLPEKFCFGGTNVDSSIFISHLVAYEKTLLKNRDILRMLDALMYRLELAAATPEEKNKIVRAFYEKYPSNQVLIRSASAYPAAFETYALFKAFSKTGYLPQYEKQMVRRYLKMKEKPFLRHKYLDVFSSEMPVVLHVESGFVQSMQFDLYPLQPEEYELFLSGAPQINEQLIQNKKMVYSKQYTLDSGQQVLCLPELEKGNYLFKISPEPSQNLSFPTTIENQWGSFQVSDLTAVEVKGEYLLVMDRRTGAYLPQVDVSFRSMDYRKPDLFHSLGQFKTDASGKVVIPQHGDHNRRIGFLIKKGEDSYYERPQYRYTNYNRNTEQLSARINTGRSIYKPGETVHLQGLILVRDDKTGIHRLDFSKEEIRIALHNQQNQIIQDKTLIVDEFGSWHTAFTLPQTTLPGVFQLRATSAGRIIGHQSIRIEEYKAPTYEIELNSMGESGDSMSVEGKVRAIAGYPIGNAEVRCEVYLQKTHWRHRFPGSNSVEKELLVTKTLETDEKGHFVLQWPKSNVKSDFFLNYLVEARVKDQAGEIQEENLRVPFSQKRIVVDWGDLEEINDLRELRTTKIQFENAAGESLQMNAQWRLSFKNFNARCFQCPDYLELWKGDEDVIDGCDRALDYYDLRTPPASEDYKFIAEGDLPYKRPYFTVQQFAKKAGLYKLELFTEQDTFSRNFSWNSVEEGKHVRDNPMVLFLSQKQVNAGEELQLLLNKSVEDELYVRFVLHQNNKIIEQKWLSVKGFQKLTIPVLESYRGNFGIHLSTVYKNKFYSYSENVDVPFSNKQLKVEFLKWPENAGTAEKEKIVLKVTDVFGRAVQTQFSLSIYDRRLDEMSPHSWNANYYPSYPNRLQLRARTGETGGIYRLVSSQKDDFEYLQYGSHVFEDIFQTNIFTPVMATDMSIKMEASRTSSKNNQLSNRQRKITAVAERSELDSKNQSGEERKSSKLRNDLATLMYFNGRIRTDKDGVAEIEFETNDAITNWSVLLHGHSKDLSYYVSKEEFQTYEPVLVEPNLPRFVHEKDEIILSAKVVNRTGEELNFRPEVKYFTNDSTQLTALTIEEGQDLTVAANASSSFKAGLRVPSGDQEITLRFSVQGDEYDDAVEQRLPVRSNSTEMVASVPIRTYQGNTTWDQQALSDLLNNPEYEIQHVGLEYTANEYIPLLIALTGTFEEEERFASEIYEKWQAFILVDRLLSIAPRLKEIFRDMKAKELPINPMADLANYRIVDIDRGKWAAAGVKSNETLYRQLDQLLNDRLRKSEINRLWQKLKELQKSDGGIKWCSNARYSGFYTSLEVAENYLRLHHLNIIDHLDQQFIKALMVYLSEYFQKIEKDEERDIMSYDRYWLSYALSWSNWKKSDDLWNPSHTSILSKRIT